MSRQVSAPEGERIPRGRRISQLAAELGDTTAIVLAHEDGTTSELSWRELEARSNRLARLLQARGVELGRFVVVGLPNSFEHFVATIAVWKAGGGVLPVNHRLPAAERRALIELADPALIVGDWEDEPGALSREGFAEADALSSESLPDVTPLPPYAIGTGGSTGRPKLIVVTVPLAETVAEMEAEDPTLDLRAGQTQLVCGPLFHGAPFSLSHHGLAARQRLVVMERFDAERALDLIERERVNWAFLVPTMLRRMARTEGIERRDFSSVEAIYHSGAAIDQDLKRRWIELLGGARIWEHYGASEDVGHTAVRGDEWLEHPGTVGRGEGGTLIRIVGEDGAELPAGEVGEVQMKFDHEREPTFEYLGSPPPYLQDGWATVGDLGSLDEDGYLYIADRRADMIVTGGSNVYCAEVEAALVSHPGVIDAAVIGLSDEEWGRRVHAIVVPADPAHAPTIDDLRAHVKALLVPYKVPKTWELVPELPRNEMGKLRRGALAEARS